MKILLESNNGSFEVELSDVKFVPGLDTNLISVKSLLNKSFIVEFEENSCYLRKAQQKRFLIGTFDGSLFKLRQFEKCYVASQMKQNCVHEWHKRLAHRNLFDIRKMKRQGLQIRECSCTDVCEACIVGKMSRKSFPKIASPVQKVLDVVVTDVCGPFQVESIGHKRYFVTFIDLHSKYSEVFFIKHKNEVNEKLMQFVERMKTQLNRKPKIIRSDRGGEYMNDVTQSFLKNEGIKFQCTVGYCPEQNGVAERKNRTLVEAARSMLIGSGLSKSLWAEAVQTANYVFNRISVNENGMSPPR